MNISFDENLGLSLHGEWIGLISIFPVVNGKVLRECKIRRLIQGEDAFALQYTGSDLYDGVLTLEVVPEGQERCRIRFHIKDYFSVLNSFGIFISEIQNLKSFLRNGYSSWDGSWYEEPENLLSVVPENNIKIKGFGMTQLIPRFGVGSMVLGFDRHDRYQHEFSFSLGRMPISLSIQTIWDQKDVVTGVTYTSDWLDIFDHNEVEEALRVWARYVSDASPIKPRNHTQPIMGWCSWYNLYGYITSENIKDQLQSVKNAANKYDLPMNVFQIDDGFTPEMGDWLEVKPEFDGGMRPLLSQIRETGFVPGLWIAPFLIGNRSKLFNLHPDWVLHDRTTGAPLVHMKFYGEGRWFKRSEEYFVLDATHPDAFEYLRQVFRTWKVEWGCDYFKTDFMHVGSMYGPEDVIYYEKGKTRIEIWRSLAEMIRDEIGDSTWLGCGCPLWASIGLVDSVRIGGDAGVTWQADTLDESLTRDLVTRNFANNIFWQLDPDCILLRKQFHYLSDLEVEARAIFTGMSGGVMMTSENFKDLDESRILLWKLFLNNERKYARLPFLGKSPITYQANFSHRQKIDSENLVRQNLDPVIVQVRDGSERGGPHAVFILNTGQYSVQRSIPFESLGFHGPFYVYEWRNFKPDTYSQWHIQITLESHEGKLLFLSKIPLSKNLAVLP